MRTLRIPALVLVVAACGGGDDGKPAPAGPALAAGAGATADPTGAADFLVDLGGSFTGEVRRAAFGLKNAGDADLPLVVEGLAPPFSLDGTPPAAVPAGGRAELVFAFTPAEAAPAAAVVTIRAGEERLRLRLAGEGHAPAVRCAPDALEFGTVLQGERLTLPFVCENGAALADELLLGGIVGDGAAAFRWDLPEGGVVRRLEAGGRFEVAVTFTPFANPEVVARIPLGRRTLDDLDSILLTGSGAAAAIDTEPPAIELGEVPTGAATPFGFSLRNRSIRENRVTLSGPPSVAFEGDPALLLPPRSLTEVAATVNPVRAGSFTANVRIVPDDTELAPVWLPVRGEAVDP